MKIVIEFNTENAAFCDPYEIDRILTQARGKIGDVGEERKLLDSNGNTVGKVTVSK